MRGRRVVVTGGAGFIGSCFVRRMLAADPAVHITVLDKLTYAGNRANLAECGRDPGQAARLRFVQGDIADHQTAVEVVRDADAIVNFAAETHVDRSILDPSAFLTTNVGGVHSLLEAVRMEHARAELGERSGTPRFLQVSTDEVYGSIDDGESVESDPLAPRSPYAAAKAAGELLARSYATTYGLDVVVTRGANTYGPYQHPEKLIPLFVTNAIDDRPLPMYGDGMQRRDWLYVDDHADAIATVLDRGVSGEAYNVAGAHQTANREVIEALLALLGKPWSLVRRVADRPGHDQRYAMAGDRLRALGFAPRVSFGDGIARTVRWYVENEGWWRSVRSGDWDAYYERQYGGRLAASSAAD
ncbi:MAG TPA: dTDP-glucose 4,6-dehydratase [Candidatus Limnocylindria bacterium]|nr:dTDP-glucose 4,6-dehydratase [Candidatus Limnocylindria bacterium]